MTRALTQQVLKKSGGRDRLGSSLREATPTYQQPASGSHTSQSSGSKLLANQVDWNRLAGKSGQFTSIYAGAIQHEDLSIPTQGTAIPAQTAFRLSIGSIKVLL